MLGAAPVVLVARGKPGGVTAKLRTMRFEDDKVAQVDAKARFMPVTSGFLLLENSTTLVLQCLRRPPATIGHTLRRYFVGYFHLSVPWSDIVIRRLAESDEGDAEAAEGDPEETPAESEPSESPLDVRVKDEWSDDESAAPPGRAVPTEDMPAVPAVVADADSARQVARLAHEVGRLTRDGRDDVALQGTVAALLQRLPPERALLALIAHGIGADAMEFAAEPVPNALTADDAGITAVVDALVAGATRIAAEMGSVGAGDFANRSHIEAMVRSIWTAAPAVSALDMMDKLVPLLTPILASGDARRIRGLLGLKGSAARDAPWREAFGLWQAACGQAAKQIEQLRSALRASDDPDLQSIASDDLAGMIDGIAGPVQRAIDGLTRGTAEPADVRRRIQQTANYLANAPQVKACDTNPFGVRVRIRDTLSAALAKLEESVHVD